jgi:hypothetical protein
LSEGILYFFNQVDPNRPVDEKYVTEIEGKRKGFVHKEDAMLYLFDNGIKTFKYLTKEASYYRDISKTPTYEFWQLQNRVGYVLYDFEPYLDEEGKVKRKRAYVWRFVGFGRSCFAKTKEELKEMVINLINTYKRDPNNFGYNAYPFYIKFNRD